jgi:hypothetical protein
LWWVGVCVGCCLWVVGLWLCGVCCCGGVVRWVWGGVCGLGGWGGGGLLSWSRFVRVVCGGWGW